MKTGKIKCKAKIRNKVFLMMIAAMILFLGMLFLVSYFIIIKPFYEKNIEQYIQETHIYSRQNMMYISKQINMQSLEIVNNQKVYDCLFSKTKTPEEKQKELDIIIFERIAGSDIIERMDIIKTGGERYNVYRTNVMEREADGEFIDSEKKYNLFLSNQVIRNVNGEKFLVFGKRLANYYTGVDAGKLIIYVKASSLGYVYENLLVEEGRAIVHKDGVILASANNNMVGSYVDEDYFYAYENNKEFVYDARTINIGGLEVDMSLIIPKNHLYDAMYLFWRNMSIVFFILAAVMLVVSYVISSGLVKSITLFAARMERYINGEKTRPSKIREDEIGQLEKQFDILVAEIEDMIERNNQEKQHQRELELVALQAQINPHFVYNAINVISSMAIINGEDKIETACLALSNFFRISLNCGKDIVTVREEMLHVQSYVEIEKLRFDGKFEVIYDISPDMYGEQMLKILIQPLVENSIKHGFKNVEKKGIINISAHVDGDDIIIVVSDNGVGLKRKIDKISSSRGYGIYNVNERIQLYYGQEYGIFYSQTDGGGTTATVKVKRIT